MEPIPTMDRCKFYRLIPSHRLLNAYKLLALDVIVTLFQASSIEGRTESSSSILMRHGWWDESVE